MYDDNKDLIMEANNGHPISKEEFIYKTGKK